MNFKELNRNLYDWLPSKPILKIVNKGYIKELHFNLK